MLVQQQVQSADCKDYIHQQMQKQVVRLCCCPDPVQVTGVQYISGFYWVGPRALQGSKVLSHLSLPGSGWHIVGVHPVRRLSLVVYVALLLNLVSSDKLETLQ